MSLARRLEGLFSESRFLAPLAFYAAFAVLVYWLQGPEPELSIDHVSYFKLANEILAAFPGGDYWRSFNTVRGYGVLLAYLHGLTGSHLESLKLLLLAMTIAYLFAFQLFIGLATRTRAEAVLFSLLSALFVSFGATLWGVTDFTASLHRTVIVPFVLVLAWCYFAFRDSGWRYLIFPALVLLSLLHLSALHVFLVFAVYETVDFALRRRLRPDRRLAQFAVALVASVAVQLGIEGHGSGAAGYVQQVAKMALPASREAPPPVATLAPGARIPPPSPPHTDRLEPQEAWRLELLAFPWRNFPPPIATIATIAASYGIIFLLAASGAVRVFRSGEANDLDRAMALFAVAIPIAAYGLQASLWILRGRTQILPFTIEEVRALNMIMVPSVWFAYRLWERMPASPANVPWLRVALVAAFALQPILVVRATPAPWREALVERLVDLGIVNRSDAPRMLYARQFLGLGEAGCRFYYASRGAVDWLQRNASPDERVLTNLNEFHLFRPNSIGPYLGVVHLQVWDPQRARWAESTEAIDRALATRDVGRVTELGRALGADYAIVNWRAEPAAYRDDCYSVVRVPPSPKELTPDGMT